MKDFALTLAALAVALILIGVVAYSNGTRVIIMDQAEFGFAFGCGRHYASNYDPADSPTDMHSKCYPYYKAWEKSEQWPRPR